MTTYTRALAIVLSLLFVGCSPLDWSHPPARSSAVLAPIAATASAAVTDRMRADLVWYDDVLDRVVRLANGEVVPVQDRAIQHELNGVPTQIRAFDDGSMIVVTDALYALPADGSAAIAISVPVHDGIDGASIEDFWIGGWALASGDLPGLTEDYGACHVLAHAISACVAFPNVGGYDGLLAVAADGSVYMTDRDVALYRYDGASVFQVDSLGDFVTSFRRGGHGLIAITYMGGAYAIDGEHTMRITDGGYLNDLAGSPDDFYFSRYAGRSENVDPNCHAGLLTSCEQRQVWSQLTVWHSVSGHVTEVGHEDCTDAMEAACSFDTVALGVDGDHGVVLGNRIRRTE